MNLFTDITDETEFISGLNEYAIELAKDELGREAIPHLIFSHGFMRWRELFREKFPSFEWKGKEEDLEGVDLNVAYNEFEKFLFGRFFTHLSGMSAFHWMTRKEKREFKEKCWEAYRED